jgi:polar amino acid transport system substrate-binding protein
MNRLYPTSLAALVLAAGLSSCGSSTADSAGSDLRPKETVAVSASEDVAKLVPAAFQAKGTITVAMDASYPPFQFFADDNKTVIGFDADFAKAVAERMGLKAKVVNIGFDTILTGIQGGRYDMAESSFSVTPERAKIVDFVEYLQGGAGIAVKPGNPQDLSMDPAVLCGHRIAAQKGTTQAIEQLPALAKKCEDSGAGELKVVLFPSQNDAVLALTSGRVDGMMADSTAVSYQAKLAKGKFELAPGDIYEARPTGIALPKGSPLEKAVAAAVKSLYADGTFEKLAAKWSIPESNYSAHPGA